MYSSKSYKENPEPKRIKARECSQKNYIKNADLKKEMALKKYHDNRKAILTLLRNEYVKNKYSKRAITQLRNSLNKENRKRINRTYVTQYWKTSLIAVILILRYGCVKSPLVYLAKSDFLL